MGLKQIDKQNILFHDIPKITDNVANEYYNHSLMNTFIIVTMII